MVKTQEIYLLSRLRLLLFVTLVTEVSLSLEGSRTSDLREFSKFRDFSENRSVLFPSALTTPTLPALSVQAHRLVSSLYPSSLLLGIGVIDPELRQN